MVLPLAPLPIQEEIYVSDALSGGRASRLFHAPRIVALWHLVSLDAPTVAVVWSLAFAWAGRIRVAGSELLVLALTAWCAYVSDRLLDARAGLHSPTESELRERHYFHWRHRQVLTPMAVVAACAAGAMAAIVLPAFLRTGGLILGAAALLYFLGVHAAPGSGRWKRTLPRKELLVAVLFTGGCILSSWWRFYLSGAAESSRLWFWIPATYFAALAWLNCSSIARWESDDKSGRARAGGSSVGRTGQRIRPSAALGIAVVGLILAIVAGAFYRRPAALLLSGAASALLLAVLDWMRFRMTALALRIAADAVLLTPLVLLLR